MLQSLAFCAFTKYSFNNLFFDMKALKIAINLFFMLKSYNNYPKILFVGSRPFASKEREVYF